MELACGCAVGSCRSTLGQPNQDKTELFCTAEKLTPVLSLESVHMCEKMREKISGKSMSMEEKNHINKFF